MKRALLLSALLLACALAAGAQADQPAQPKPSLSKAMRSLRTIAVHSKTDFVQDDMVIGELQKHKELDEWGVTVVTGEADALIEVDHTPFTFIYNYKMVHRATGIVLAADKFHAVTGPEAAEKVAEKIIERMAKYRNVKPEDHKTEPGREKGPGTPK
jgi:hypothetical protein